MTSAPKPSSASKVLFGFHAVGVRIKTAPASVIEVYFETTRRDARMRQFLERAKEAGVRLIEADSLRIAKLAGSHGHQGVAALVDAEMGAGTAERMVIDALRSEESSAALGDKLSVDSEALDEDDRRAVVAVTLGRGLAEVAKALPDINDTKMLKLLSSERHAAMEGAAHKAMVGAVSEGLKRKIERLNVRVKTLKTVAA